MGAACRVPAVCISNKMPEGIIWNWDGLNAKYLEYVVLSALFFVLSGHDGNKPQVFL